MAHAHDHALDRRSDPAPGLRAAPAPAPAKSHGSWPTLDHVWAILSGLIPAIVSLGSTMVAIDLAYHVRAGVEVLGGSIPRVDTWTFTVAGTPWVDQQWGAQALMAAIHEAGGFAAIALLRAGLTGLAFAMVYLACRARGADARSSSLLSLTGFIVCLQALAMRPQTFAVTIFAAFLWILAGRRAHPARLWALPVLAILWANTHGSFVLAPVLLGLALVEDRLERDPGWKRLLLVAGLSVTATLVNPFGFGAWIYVKDLSTNPVIRDTITEWAPISVSTFSGVAFFVTALVIAGWLARRARPVPWVALLWLGTFFALALPAKRGVIWWALVASVVVAGLLASDRYSESTPGRRSINLVVIGVLAAVAIALFPWMPWRSSSNAALLREAPGGLSTATTALPAGTRVLVPQPWGSWFAYASPRTPVFVDPRIELYPADVWQDYLTVRTAGAGWQEILDRYGVEAIVVDRRTWGSLIDELSSDAGWHLEYRGEEGAVYVRVQSVPPGHPS